MLLLRNKNAPKLCMQNLFIYNTLAKGGMIKILFRDLLLFAVLLAVPFTRSPSYDLR